MLKKLAEVEAALPSLLANREDWRSLLVDYETPHVWRLWRQYDAHYRVFLHKIFPCDRALLHPHPWPSAVRIFTPRDVSYETAAGFGPPDGAEPPLPATFFLKGGSTYEMVHEHGWHYVRPIGGPIYSVMVTGQPFEARPRQQRFGHGHKHGPLNESQRLDLLGFFWSTYGRP